MKTVTESFEKKLHVKWIKQMPQQVCMAIANSHYCLTGKINWVKMTIENTQIKQMDRTGKTFKGIPQEWIAGLPQNVTLAVQVGEKVDANWEVSLVGVDYNTFLLQDIRISRDDDYGFNVVMADESSELAPDVVVSTTGALNYICPFLFPEGKVKFQAGRQPRVQEILGMSGHAGSVVLGMTYRDGQWLVVTQGETKLDGNNQLVRTRRATRYNVKNVLRPEIPENGSVFASYDVALDPRLILAGHKPEGGLVKVLFYEYDSNWQLPADQTLTSITEFLTYGDGPGTVALFQWLMFRFGDILPNLEANTQPAKLGNLNENVTPISVGVVKNGTWSVLVRDGEMYDHNGQTFSCLLGYGFDDTKLDAVSKKHQFDEVDPNTKRESSINAETGAMPVEVHEFQQKDLPQNLNGYKAEALGDFAQDGDGLAQIAVAKWLWHLYGAQLATIDPRVNRLPAISN